MYSGQEGQQGEHRRGHVAERPGERRTRTPMNAAREATSARLGHHDRHEPLLDRHARARPDEEIRLQGVSAHRRRRRRLVHRLAREPDGEQEPEARAPAGEGEPPRLRLEEVRHDLRAGGSAGAARTACGARRRAWRFRSPTRARRRSAPPPGRRAGAATSRVHRRAVRRRGERGRAIGEGGSVVRHRRAFYRGPPGPAEVSAPAGSHPEASRDGRVRANPRLTVSGRAREDTAPTSRHSDPTGGLNDEDRVRPLCAGADGAGRGGRAGAARLPPSPRRSSASATTSPGRRRTASRPTSSTRSSWSCPAGSSASTSSPARSSARSR